jgi:hypothetical protein
MHSWLICASSIAMLFSLQGCLTPPPEYATASGKPETTIQASPEKIKPLIVGKMLSRGYRITRDTPYELSFDKPSDNLAVMVLLGSKYDIQPNARVSYSFAPIGAETRIVADMAIITNPGSSFERRTDVNSSGDSPIIQGLLNDVKAEITVNPPAPTASSSKPPRAVR